MKVFNDVKSTSVNIPEIEVGIDTVYVRENITDVSDKDYPNLKNIGTETHYGKDEYIELMSEKTKSQDMVIEDLMFNVIPFLGGI